MTKKWVWHVELIKVQLYMKFQSCRMKHFDFRDNVKNLNKRQSFPRKNTALECDTCKTSYHLPCQGGMSDT
ncbi:hypothetical protein DPMN_037879, partial [Dreissena polymorpha]